MFQAQAGAVVAQLLLELGEDVVQVFQSCPVVAPVGFRFCAAVSQLACAAQVGHFSQMSHEYLDQFGRGHAWAKVVFGNQQVQGHPEFAADEAQALPARGRG